jgi:four helix bundle protein
MTNETLGITNNDCINEYELEKKENKQDEEENPAKIYDIRERTLQFGIRIVNIARDIPVNMIYSSIKNQMVKSGTAIGSNLAEGDGAKTKRDFINKLVISRKEAKETKYWLRLIDGLNLDKLKLEDEVQEVQEIINILSAIIKKIDESGREKK